MAASRKGLSLSVKLILTTALVVAAGVGAAAWSSVSTINELAQSEAAARRVSGEERIARQADAIARRAASAAALPMAEGNQTYLNTLVQQIVGEDPMVRWVEIAEVPGGRVIARWPADAARDGSLLQFSSSITAGTTTIGEIRLGVTTAALEEELARSVASARERGQAAARRTALIAALILVVGIILALIQALRITRPIGELSHQAHRIAEGDLAHRVTVASRDEIGVLADDFNFMADRVRTLIAEAAAKAGLEKEMELARAVQSSMIPPPHLIEHGPFRVVGHYEPATACGGDWWTVHLLDGDRMLLAVGDVTGHGVAAALVAATARGAVEALAATDERLLEPQQVLRAIDGAIRGVGGEQLLMTCFVALLDANRGVIDYSNAAHNFPYVTHVDEQRTVKQLGVLAMRGSPLGHRAGELKIDSGQRRLAPGDTLVFFTDGVIDRVGRGGDRFGDRRLRGMLLGRTFGEGAAAIMALRSDIVSELTSFAGGAPADDDVTLVLCQYDPPTAAGTGSIRRRALA